MMDFVNAVIEGIFQVVVIGLFFGLVFGIPLALVYAVIHLAFKYW